MRELAKNRSVPFKWGYYMGLVGLTLLLVSLFTFIFPGVEGANIGGTVLLMTALPLVGGSLVFMAADAALYRKKSKKSKR